MFDGRPDITSLPDLAEGAGRVGPVRTRMPIYVDLLPPCNNACPAGENIQEWLRLIKENEPEAAWRQLVRDNPFPAIHGRVCYHPCETACNRVELDSAVSIHSVERYLGDLAIERGWTFSAPRNNTGYRVLVVGAGPSGLSAAYHLARVGHEVEIRDAGELPGGMMRYGIPEYRLPRDVVDAEIRRIQDLGVKIALNHPCRICSRNSGRAGSTQSSSRSAPTCPSGSRSRAWTPARWSTPSTSCATSPPVRSRRSAAGWRSTVAATPPWTPHGGPPMGAEEAVIIYRRTQEQMPAHAEELADAEREGVKVHWLRTISEVSEQIEVEIMELDEWGKPRGTGTYEKLPADTVIMAVGQVADTGFLRNIPGLRFVDDVVQVDPATLMTDVPGIFAGGDAVPSERTVTIGVGHGKKAAKRIDAWLNRRQEAPKIKHPIVGFDDLNLWYFGDHPRSIQHELSPAERVQDFGEVVAGLTNEEAEFEARRCLSCGNCFECDGCYGACPEDAIIKLGKGHRYRFDYAKCTGCATCYEQCPVHAIEMIAEK